MTLFMMKAIQSAINAANLKGSVIPEMTSNSTPKNRVSGTCKKGGSSITTGSMDTKTGEAWKAFTKDQYWSPYIQKDSAQISLTYTFDTPVSPGDYAIALSLGGFGSSYTHYCTVTAEDGTYILSMGQTQNTQRYHTFTAKKPIKQLYFFGYTGTTANNVALKMDLIRL